MVTGDARLARNPRWMEWQKQAKQVRDYLSSVRPDFAIRDDNAKFSFELRHGLVETPIPPSHAEVVPDTATSTKMYNEILNRLVSILSSVYPQWIFHPDGMAVKKGLKSAELATFDRSLWLTVEDRAGIPIIRQFMDQQLSVGGAFFKVHLRLDRWEHLPHREEGESTRAHDARVKMFKAQNPPFDITVPEYDKIYYDLTVDGLVRFIENKRISVYEAAREFGGHYNEKLKTLFIPVEMPITDAHGEIMLDDDMNVLTEILEVEIQSDRELEYNEYQAQGEQAVFMLNDTVVRVDELDHDEPLSLFLGLGEVTSSPDPGRMGLPILYNAFETFIRQIGLIGMEYSFLWKHGYARLVKTERDDTALTEEPELPNQEDEEEVIGEILHVRKGEDWRYLVPGNVSVLFADAKNDVAQEIDKVALADILTGRLPPAGTTGFLMSQLATAAVSKYIPILHQAARAIRLATLFINNQIDRKFQSAVVVPVQQSSRQESGFATFTPKVGGHNQNLEVRIKAPLPSDRIATTQWLALGEREGHVSRERVQREGYELEQPELEDEKIELEAFNAFYRPIRMIKAMQRAGQIEQVLEAARLGLLPPQLAELAFAFAQGPDGLLPTDNPNGIIQPQPGLGQPGEPSTGATVNARPQFGRIGQGGRASGAPRRPANQPGEPIVQPPRSPA